MCDTDTVLLFLLLLLFPPCWFSPAVLCPGSGHAQHVVAETAHLSRLAQKIHVLHRTIPFSAVFLSLEESLVFARWQETLPDPAPSLAGCFSRCACPPVHPKTHLPCNARQQGDGSCTPIPPQGWGALFLQGRPARRRRRADNASSRLLTFAAL